MPRSLRFRLLEFYVMFSILFQKKTLNDPYSQGSLTLWPFWKLIPKWKISKLMLTWKGRNTQRGDIQGGEILSSTKGGRESFIFFLVLDLSHPTYSEYLFAKIQGERRKESSHSGEKVPNVLGDISILTNRGRNINHQMQFSICIPCLRTIEALCIYTIEYSCVI